MAPHSSTLAWKLPWTGVVGCSPWGCQGSDTTERLHFHFSLSWHPTPVFLPGESRGQGSLVGCRLWGRTESDKTEATQQQQQCQLFDCPVPSASCNFELIILVGGSLSGTGTSHLHTPVVSLSQVRLFLLPFLILIHKFSTRNLNSHSSTCSFFCIFNMCVFTHMCIQCVCGSQN